MYMYIATHHPDIPHPLCTLFVHLPFLLPYPDQDMAVSGVFAVLLFITGIPLAVYASEWDDELDDAPSIIKDSLKKLPPSLRAASVRLCMLGTHACTCFNER